VDLGTVTLHPINRPFFRLQYLVLKGTKIKRGERIEVELRKFSSSSYGACVFAGFNPVLLRELNFFRVLDSIFETVLYTSDSDQIMRYTDEGETNELCRCYVDLAPLPNFQAQARTIPSGGFYTGGCALLPMFAYLRRHNEWATTILHRF
jgi:hypothetical protein